MSDNFFDIQRFAGADSLKNVVNLVKAISKNDNVIDGVNIVINNRDLSNIAAELIDSVKDIRKDLENHNYSDSFLESLRTLANALDGLFSPSR